MLLHTPDFWRKTSVLSYLLLPLSLLYRFYAGVHQRSVTPYRAPVPVICVGNITMGGAGKTPVAIVLAEICREYGHQVHFLSRGYGRKDGGLVQVDPAIHTAAEVGDEPLLLSRHGTVWVCSDRIAAVHAAAEAGASIVIMDDGMQNPSLIKDMTFLVVDGSYGFGNHLLFPAGPLREGLTSARKRINAALILGEDKTGIMPLLSPHFPVIRGTIVPELEHLKGHPVIAFAGIGNPQKFFDMLKAGGVTLVESLAFPDHYPYTAEDGETLLKKAAASNALLVTTEKDAVRFSADMQSMLHVITIDIHWENEQALISCMYGLLRN